MRIVELDLRKTIKALGTHRSIVFILVCSLAPGAMSQPSFAKTPKYQPLTVEQKIAQSDYVFVGSVIRIVLIRWPEFKELTEEPTDTRTFDAHAEIEIEERLFEQGTSLPHKILFSLGGGTRLPDELRKKYTGNRFIFFARLNTFSRDGVAIRQYSPVHPSEGTESAQKRDEVLNAIVKRRQGVSSKP